MNQYPAWKYLLIILALASPVHAEPFITIGAGIIDSNEEINLSNPLGIFEAGYKLDSWTIKATHISGLLDREKGYGANMLSINYTWTF